MTVVVEEAAVVFDGVTKAFARRPAVRELDLCVPVGSIYGLLGPNGAGKTTSIRMLMAILAPDAGSIRVLGVPPDAATKDRIGYLPEERGLYPGMKVVDNLVFFATIRGVPAAEARSRAHRWLDRMGIGDVAEQKLQELSKGNQQKVQFVATVCHEPRLLVLDEPFSGLDPVNQDLVRATIRELADTGATVILSTHLMDEVERLCSEIMLIDEGRTIVSGRLDDVKRRHGTDTVRVEVADGAETVAAHPQAARVSRRGGLLEIRLTDGVDPADFLASIATRARIRRFEVEAPSLHRIFVDLVGRRESDPEAARAAEVTP